MNLLARRHARAFLRFDPHASARARTAAPEQLSTADKLELLVHGVTVPRPSNVRTPAALGLDYRALTVTTEDGETLDVWRIPADRAVPVGVAVLLHGYAQAKDSLLEPAAGLVALGFTCYLVDFRGSGESSAAYTTIGVDEARDVRAVVEEVEREESPPILLYGVSMGAVAILRALAREQVHADAVILDAPFDRMLTTVRNRFETMGVPSFPAAELLVFWGGHEFGFAGFDHNGVDYAAAVTAPTLIVHGSDDPRARPAEVERVYAALAGPKRIVRFAEVGHAQIAVVRADAWRVEVAEFLANVL